MRAPLVTFTLCIVQLIFLSYVCIVNMYSRNKICNTTGNEFLLCLRKTVHFLKSPILLNRFRSCYFLYHSYFLLRKKSMKNGNVAQTNSQNPCRFIFFFLEQKTQKYAKDRWCVCPIVSVLRSTPQKPKQIVDPK